MEFKGEMNWVVRQTAHSIAQFEKSMETHYPQTARYLYDPEKYYVRVTKECNYLDAVKAVEWDKFLKPGSEILDLGGGSGWVSAFLSKHQNIAKVYLLDSSRHFLGMMPAIVALAQGKVEKISAIEGLFLPLFFPDDSLDAVVICSSLHHADNMEDLLKEIRRVLKNDGHLFILNETPAGDLSYLKRVIKESGKIFLNTVTRKYMAVSPALSSSGFLYDPYLHDKAYPLWYWREAITRSGLRLVSLIDTGMPTVKGDKKDVKLKHFICQKSSGVA